MLPLAPRSLADQKRRHRQVKWLRTAGALRRHPEVLKDVFNSGSTVEVREEEALDLRGMKKEKRLSRARDSIEVDTVIEI